MPTTKEAVPANDATLILSTAEWEGFVKSLNSIGIARSKLAAAMRKYREWRTANLGSEISTAKQQIISLLNSLPDDCSLDDIQYQLYVLTKVRRSEEEVKSGATLSHEEVTQRLSKWLNE